MPHAIRIHSAGGPEVLSWEEVDAGEPGPGELRVRQTAVGLNYIDTYHRSGLYKLAYPAVIGQEGAGIVEAVGADVAGIKAGDRIAYGTSLGAYAEVRLLPAEKAIKLPDSISDRTAAAMMLQGMTVEYLIRRTYKVEPGDTVLLHAAAGGVGLIAGQWLNHLGATVIGTVGSEEKAAIARAHGCHHVINYRTQDFVAEVKRITEGKGVPVVYDGVGKDTFAGSLDCLRPRGLMVSFGNASGPVPPVDVLQLSAKGSLYLTRPTLFTYTATRADLEESANSLLSVVAGGAVKIEVAQTYPLREAAQAHRDLEARKTTGSTVFLV